MKKISLFILCYLFLAGCNGEENVSPLQSKVYIDKQEGFKIEVNSSLIILEKNELPFGVITGFLDVLNRQNEFTPNLHITKEKILYQDISTALYMESFIRKTAQTLPGYLEKRTFSRKIANQDTQIHLFEINKEVITDWSTQKSEDFRFIQTAIIKPDTQEVYIITATLKADATNKQNNIFIEAMESFSFEIID